MFGGREMENEGARAERMEQDLQDRIKSTGLSINSPLNSIKEKLCQHYVEI